MKVIKTLDGSIRRGKRMNKQKAKKQVVLCLYQSITHKPHTQGKDYK